MQGFSVPQRNRMVVQDFILPHEAARLRKMGMVSQQYHAPGLLVYHESTDTCLLLPSSLPSLQSLYHGQTAKEETAFSFQVQYLGLSPQAAARAVKAGSISAEDAQLYLTVIERIRRTVTEQFKLRTELYHHFTHIVCRSPSIGGSLLATLHYATPLAPATSFLTEAPLVSEGAYLPAHADSCNLNITTGHCHHSSKAFAWRHYT